MKKIYIVFMLLLFCTAIALNAQTKKETNSKEVNTLLQKANKLVILDVRTAEEFKDGHIKGAINIDIKQSDALAKIDKLDHSSSYIVHCRTNHRSAIAVEHMVKSGFKNVSQMMDGYTGWVDNNLPIVK